MECTGDFCCEILFYCGDCSLFCMLWNLLSIPIRIAISSIILGMMIGLGGVLCFFVITVWFCVCLVGGLCPIPMEIICSDDTPCLAKILMVLFYPITVLVCWFMAIKESHQIPC